MSVSVIVPMAKYKRESAVIAPAIAPALLPNTEAQRRAVMSAPRTPLRAVGKRAANSFSPKAIKLAAFIQ